MRLTKKHIIPFLLGFFILGYNLNYGQRIKTPMDVQLKIIPKVLSLDKNFESRKKGEFNLAVIFSSIQRNSNQISKYVEEAVRKKSLHVKNTKVNITYIDLAKVSQIDKELINNKIDVAYITPLRGVDINSIAKVCKQEQILTVTGVLDFMENDISVSFDIKDKKMQIIINNNAAKREGTNFSSRLLRIAKII